MIAVLQVCIAGLYCGIMLRDYTTELHGRITSRDYITYEIILLHYITDLYYGIILQKHIMGLYYGFTITDCIIEIIRQIHFTELYYGTI